MVCVIVYVVNMGVLVINIFDVMCMSVCNVIDQCVLGVVVYYVVVDKDVVIVVVVGDGSKKDCKQNLIFDFLQFDDLCVWNVVIMVVIFLWFYDYVLMVGVVDVNG